jgi:hypothetical protein
MIIGYFPEDSPLRPQQWNYSRYNANVEVVKGYVKFREHLPRGARMFAAWLYNVDKKRWEKDVKKDKRPSKHDILLAVMLAKEFKE